MKRWHIGAALFALWVLSSGGEARQNMNKASQRKEASQATSEFVRNEHDRTRDAKRLSGVALDRYKNNCTLIVSEVTGEEVIHHPGTPVVDSATKQRLPEGTEVCNTRGWTARLDANGAVDASTVAKASRHDSDKDGNPDIEQVRGYFND